MKKLNYFIAVALGVSALSFASCEKSTSSDDDPTLDLTEAEQALLDNYVENIVEARYSQLATDGKTLLNAAEAIKTSTDTDKTDLILAATEAWQAARVSWERTEAYLFGPVDKAGIDPGIDSWPLVLPDLQEKIQSWDVSASDLAADSGDLKGFHAIEYIIFADGAAKAVSVTYFDSEYEISQGSLSDEEFEDNLESYLVAVCNELYRCVLQLEAEWNLAGLSSSKSADYAEFGSQITLNTTGGNYGDIFANPSLDNAYYSSFNACLSEALQGAIGIADEVANVKISDPINAEIASPGQGLLEVESWFSHNSLSDFLNNVRGIKEAIFGELYTSESFDTSIVPNANSIAALLVAADAEAGAATIAAANAAIAAVKAMPSPFRDNLSWGAENTAAKEAIATLQEQLENAETILVVR
ncbi:MAG: imelysin family protein [Rikenellaceae bacterium]